MTETRYQQTANAHLVQRLEGIRKSLIALHQAGHPMSSNSKGSEREDFIAKFLEQVFPPNLRFGTGDATDCMSNMSGQLDIVVEHEFGLSITAAHGSGPRLYLAEAIAAVIEVKSDLVGQWSQLIKTAEKLGPLRRNLGVQVIMGGPSPGGRIPLYAVGYTGWKNIETLEQKLAESAYVDGILCLEHSLFIGRAYKAQGLFALWAFICDLHRRIISLQGASPDLLRYVDPPSEEEIARQKEQFAGLIKDTD